MALSENIQNEFLANVIHEIQTPLNAITEISELMLKGDLDIEQKWNAENIHNSANLINGIIRDVLELSEIKSGTFSIIEKTYSIQSLIQDIYAIIQTQLMYKNVSLILEINPTVPEFLKGDKLHIQQILLNITNNAVKFTDSGSISISVDWNGSINDTILIFSVKDTGKGINPELINRIFTNCSYENNYAGSDKGLGLLISKNLAKMMNGTLSAENIAGNGSAFRLEIPQKVERYTPAGDEASENITGHAYDNEKENFESTVTMPSARVLIVDDNRINLNISKNILSMYYRITADTASGGIQAINKITSHQYDLVLIDHIMNDMNGNDVLKEIKMMNNPQLNKIPFIAFTANCSVHTESMLINEGMSDFISKPVNIQELDKVLRKWIPENLQITKEMLSSDKNLKSEPSGISEKNTIDMDKGIMFFSDNKEEYLNILKSVYNDGYRQIDDMREFIKNQDFKGYMHRIFALKSISSNIGAEALFKIAKAHEFAYNNNDFSFINHNFSILIRKYEVLLSEIKNILIKENKSPDKKNKNNNHEYNSIGTALLKTAELIDDFDIQGAKSELERIYISDKTDWIKKQVIKRAVGMLEDCCYLNAKNLVTAMAEGEK